MFTINEYASGCNHNIVHVRDHLGRLVELPKKISRIVSLAPSITEIVFSLENQDKLVGVTKYSDYPVNAKFLPNIGSYVHPDLEKIVALKPDLCLAIKDGNPMELIDRLEFLGVPVYVIDPRDLNSVLSTIIDIGFLLCAEVKASALISLLNDRINRIKTVVSKAKDNPRVFFQLGVSPIISAGRDTFIHDLIRLVHGTNVMENVRSYPYLSREDVLRLSPDVIVITSMKKDDALSREKSEWEEWPELPAISNNSVFVEDSNLFDRPSPRLVDGLELLALRVHPELFEEYP